MDDKTARQQAELALAIERALAKKLGKTEKSPTNKTNKGIDFYTTNKKKGIGFDTEIKSFLLELKKDKREIASEMHSFLSEVYINDDKTYLPFIFQFIKDLYENMYNINVRRNYTELFYDLKKEDLLEEYKKSLYEILYDFTSTVTYDDEFTQIVGKELGYHYEEEEEDYEDEEDYDDEEDFDEDDEDDEDYKKEKDRLYKRIASINDSNLIKYDLSVLIKEFNEPKDYEDYWSFVYDAATNIINHLFVGNAKRTKGEIFFEIQNINPPLKFKIPLYRALHRVTKSSIPYDSRFLQMIEDEIENIHQHRPY